MLFKDKPSGETSLERIVEAGTVATLQEVSAGELTELAVGYHESGNSFMLDMVAKAAVANQAELSWANSGELPKDAQYLRTE